MKYPEGLGPPHLQDEGWAKKKAAMQAANPQSMPPLLTQGLNLAKAVALIVKRYASGQGRLIVPDNILDARIAECDRCVRNVEGRCTACGCLVKFKIPLATERCPDTPSKWPAV